MIEKPGKIYVTHLMQALDQLRDRYYEKRSEKINSYEDLVGFLNNIRLEDIYERNKQGRRHCPFGNYRQKRSWLQNF